MSLKSFLRRQMKCFICLCFLTLFSGQSWPKILIIQSDKSYREFRCAIRLPIILILIRPITHERSRRTFWQKKFLKMPDDADFNLRMFASRRAEKTQHAESIKCPFIIDSPSMFFITLAFHCGRRPQLK